MSQEQMGSAVAKLTTLVGLMSNDFDSLCSPKKKNAAPSCRKHLASISKECTQLRKDVLAYSKGLPIKKREKILHTFFTTIYIVMFKRVGKSTRLGSKYYLCEKLDKISRITYFAPYDALLMRLEELQYTRNAQSYLNYIREIYSHKYIRQHEWVIKLLMLTTAIANNRHRFCAVEYDLFKLDSPACAISNYFRCLNVRT